jgi:hypothetical protein
MGSDVAIAWQVAAAGDLPPVWLRSGRRGAKAPDCRRDGKNERGARGRERRLDAPKKPAFRLGQA